MISVITPTGDRQLSLDWCRDYVRRQTVPVQWVVVDDGIDPYDPGADIYVRRVRKPSDQAHTLPHNLEAAIDAATGDFVFVFEDDDWYAPDHIERLLPHLKEASVVGWGDRLMYWLNGCRYIRKHRPERIHLPLATTAWRASEKEAVRRACYTAETIFRVDKYIWMGAAHPCIIWEPPRMVSIKGLPGRPGSSEHKQRTGHIDQDGSVLRRWLGDDAERYTPFRVRSHG